MTFAEKLTLVSVVGTCGAAVATLLAVLEMRWQRRTTYKPDLIAEATGFEIYPDGTDHFATISVDRKRPTGHFARLGVPVLVRNAGFGPAKNVTYSWETDVLGFLEGIGKIAPAAVASAEFDAKHETLTIGDAKAGGQTIHNLSTQMRGTRPAIMADATSAVPMPPAYLHLLMMSLNVRAKRELELRRTEEADHGRRHLLDMGVFEGWPPLMLVLSCKDLGGYHHTKRLTVQPGVEMLHFGDVNSEERSAVISVTVAD